MRHTIIVLCVLLCGVLGSSTTARADSCGPERFNGTYDTNFGVLDLKAESPFSRASYNIRGGYSYEQSNRLMAFGTITGFASEEGAGCKMVLKGTWNEDRRVAGGRIETYTGTVTFELNGTHIYGTWQDDKTKQRGSWSGPRR